MRRTMNEGATMGLRFYRRIRCHSARGLITSVKVVEILGGHVVSGLGRDFGEGGGLVVAEAVHRLLGHVAML